MPRELILVYGIDRYRLLLNVLVTLADPTAILYWDPSMVNGAVASTGLEGTQFHCAHQKVSPQLLLQSQP